MAAKESRLLHTRGLQPESLGRGAFRVGLVGASI